MAEPEPNPPSGHGLAKGLTSKKKTLFLVVLPLPPISPPSSPAMLRVRGAGTGSGGLGGGFLCRASSRQTHGGNGKAPPALTAPRSKNCPRGGRSVPAEPGCAPRALIQAPEGPTPSSGVSRHPMVPRGVPAGLKPHGTPRSPRVPPVGTTELGALCWAGEGRTGRRRPGSGANESCPAALLPARKRGERRTALNCSFRPAAAKLLLKLLLLRPFLQR